MRRSRWLALPALLLACLLGAPSASALSIGQIDTFEDGTTQGWLVGLLGASSPVPPTNVATQGPGGVDDNFLLLTARGGSAAGSRLSVINLDQWTGDFVAVGIDNIQMDVKNLGETDLSLRLLFTDRGLAPPTNLAFSSAPVFLPAQSGWTPVLFPIAASDLTAQAGSVLSALTNAGEMRIFHSETAEFEGPSIEAQLGVDNIRAVPEPTTLGLLGFGLLGACLAKAARPAGAPQRRA